ncbi:hypothetical protein BDW69DRAFT_156678 [Aspergillus filifer]
MIPDNGSWEAEEGVPHVDDPFIQRFLQGRLSLIEREEAQRHDANLAKSLPPVAKRACEIVSRVCTQELVLLQQDGYQPDNIPHPSLMSDTAKARLQGSDLWKIVRQLPKGSLLHGHLPAMVDADFLIDQAFATPGFHVSAPKPLTTQRDFQDAPFSFHFVPSTRDSNDKPTLWVDNYEPSTLINLHSAAAAFPNGGETGFRKWLKSRCSLASGLSENTPRGSKAISDIFSKRLPIIDSILHHEPILRVCLRAIFSQLAADRIRYVELRIAFTFQYTLQGKDEPEQDYFGWFRIFQEELEAFKKSEKGKDFHEARVIWASMRNQSNQVIGSDMKECIITKMEFPDLICGFDLLGSETNERPLADLVPLLFWFRGLCAEEGMEIPFTLHAGHCLTDGDQADDNLFDAALLGARRVSQALSLYKHPLLIDVLKQKNILIDYSPTSSACLGFTNSFQAHPLPALLSRGVSVALTNDSPGLFGLGENGLSTEIYQALVSFNSMGLSGATMMLENSVRWSSYEDQNAKEWATDLQEAILGEGTKAARLHEFYADFEEFCAWVVENFEKKYSLE